MTTHLIHIFGRDRVGLLAETARIAEEHHINVVQCMAHTICGMASLDVVVSGPAEGASDFINDLSEHFSEVGEPLVSSTQLDKVALWELQARTFKWTVRFDSDDRKGLLATISNYLAHNDITLLRYEGIRRSGRPQAYSSQLFEFPLPSSADHRDVLAGLEVLADEHGYYNLAMTPPSLHE